MKKQIEFFCIVFLGLCCIAIFSYQQLIRTFFVNRIYHSASCSETAVSLRHFMLEQCSEQERNQLMQIVQINQADQKDAESCLRDYEKAFVQVKFGKVNRFIKFMYQVNQNLYGINSLAYHLAGKTILLIYAFCGIQLKWTSLHFLKGGIAGYVYFTQYQTLNKIELINTIMMLLSGGISEQLYEGKEFITIQAAIKNLMKRYSMKHDIQQIRNRIQQLQKDFDEPETEQQLLEKYYEKTKQLLEQHYDKVEIIAQALIKQKFLPCYTIYALL